MDERLEMNLCTINNYEFSDDILRLYVKTGSKKIQREFIKLCSSEQLVTYIKSRDFQNLPFNNAQTASALGSLVKMRGKLGPAPTLPEAVTYIVGGAISNPDLQTMRAFAEMVGTHSEVLSPFTNILQYMDHFSGDAVPSSSLFDPDLEMVHEAYLVKVESDLYGDYGVAGGGRKATKKEQLASMFSEMVSRFSNDIAGVANRTGNPELASAIQGGALLNIAELSQHIEVGKIDYHIKGQADRILKMIMKNLDADRAESNYEYIKEKMFGFLSLVSLKELVEYHKSREESLDTSWAMTPRSIAPSEVPIPSLEVWEYAWLDKNFLAMLTMFLAYFHGRVMRGR